MIGGSICGEPLPPGLLPGDGQSLSTEYQEVLWRLFVEIGKCWHNVLWESSNLKSSWLEMVQAKTTVAPSYVQEYINAVYVVRELMDMLGDDAFDQLFLHNGIPPGPPTTRLAHAKKYVIDEFITMQVMASGFKHYGGKNYHGYIKGSRYNLVPPVRTYVPPPPGADVPPPPADITPSPATRP